MSKANQKRDVLWTRVIAHVDMDAFYAAIEQRDFPDYQGKPVIVGGNPHGRGVVSTASYEARKFGIHSAMPSSQALRLCPKGIFLKPRMEAYKSVSKMVMAILKKYTDLIEPVSLDEAYMDITKNKLGIDNPSVLASMIKQNIFAATKLTASAGIAPNFFLAKVASDMDKPDGLTLIYPDEVEQFLKDLPVRKIPGIGPVTEKTLHREKFFTCGDIAAASPIYFHRKFGKWGSSLHQKAMGIDYREIEVDWEPKQCSTENTFPEDINDIPFLNERLEEYACEVFEYLKKKNRTGKTVVLKVKYHDFEVITRSKTLSQDIKSPEEIAAIAKTLLLKKTSAGTKPIRLIGLGISGLKSLSETPSLQSDLFEATLPSTS